MESLLVARQLRKSFGKLTAVDGIDLEVRAGECLALLGPNGAGKTTTVEMLEGLQTPDSGTITLFGQDLKRERSAIMQRVGVMLQDTQLYKKLTVRETLALFASFFRHSLAVDVALAQVGLQDKADSRLEELSGGQKQRAYLACSLINEPQLLFLDEPTTGLDPQARRLIWDLLRQHKGRERGILLTTQYMDEAEQLADRVAIVDHGKIIAEGTPQELIHRVCGEQVLRFRFRHPDPAAARLQLLPQLPWMEDVILSGEYFELVSSQALERLAALNQAAAGVGLVLDQLDVHRATLEDVFIKLTGRSIRDV